MKATWTGWYCPHGPEELVDYLVDVNRSLELTYDEFTAEVDISTAPLSESQFQILKTDWAVNFIITYLPSGQRAYVLQHAGIEYLFTPDKCDIAKESALAVELGENDLGSESDPATVINYDERDSEDS